MLNKVIEHYGNKRYRKKVKEKAVYKINRYNHSNNTTIPISCVDKYLNSNDYYTLRNGYQTTKNNFNTQAYTYKHRMYISCEIDFCYLNKQIRKISTKLYYIIPFSISLGTSLLMYAEEKCSNIFGSRRFDVDKYNADITKLSETTLNEINEKGANGYYPQKFNSLEEVFDAYNNCYVARYKTDVTVKPGWENFYVDASNSNCFGIEKNIDAIYNSAISFDIATLSIILGAVFVGSMALSIALLTVPKILHNNKVIDEMSIIIGGNIADKIISNETKQKDQGLYNKP